MVRIAAVGGGVARLSASIVCAEAGADVILALDGSRKSPPVAL
jgi:hypothetical protein